MLLSKCYRFILFSLFSGSSESYSSSNDMLLLLLFLFFELLLLELFEVNDTLLSLSSLLRLFFLIVIPFGTRLGFFLVLPELEAERL